MNLLNSDMWLLNQLSNQGLKIYQSCRMEKHEGENNTRMLASFLLITVLTIFLLSYFPLLSDTLPKFGLWTIIISILLTIALCGTIGFRYSIMPVCEE